MRSIIRFLVLCFIVICGSNVKAQTVADINVANLQSEFNAMQGFPRVIFIGDPTCPGCIASANDLRNYIFYFCDNPDLRGLIVWIHKSGFFSTRNNAIAQSALWSDSRLSFYWDSIGTDVGYAFGYQGGWSGCTYAWDISMVYPATATWTGIYPPQPYYCMSKTGCCNPYSLVSERNALITLGACYNTTGIEDIYSQNNFTVYPNPVANEFLIPDFGFRIFSIDIYDVLGNKMNNWQLSNGKNKIDVSKFHPGIYFITLRDGQNNFITRKLIKE